MTVDVEEEAEKQTEHWKDFEYLMKRTLDMTEDLVRRSLGRKHSRGLIVDFYKAGMTEDEILRTIGNNWVT